MIPSADPGGRYRRHRAIIDRAIQRVLERGSYILSEEVEQFEREFATYIGSPFGVGVANGTDALHLALHALGIGAGDEVITVSHTAVATISGIEQAGADVRFVDIVPETFTINPEKIESAITPKTRAIVVVHLYGHPANMKAVSQIATQHDLRIVEDCAQAHGSQIGDAHVGVTGDAATFSFYPTKNLGAFGDGGFIACRDSSIAERLRQAREYGWKERYISLFPGYNSRLDEIQAAILRDLLPFLRAENDRRREIASAYDYHFTDLNLGLPRELDGMRHTYHQYVVRTPSRDSLREHLTRRGVGTAIHYPVPVHLQPAYAGKWAGLMLKESELAATEVLSLPIYPDLSEKSLQHIVEAVSTFFADGRDGGRSHRALDER